MKHLLIGWGRCPAKHASLRMSPIATANPWLMMSGDTAADSASRHKGARTYLRGHATLALEKMLQDQRCTMKRPEAGFPSHHSGNGSIPGSFACSLACSALAKDLRPALSAAGFVYCTKAFCTTACQLKAYVWVQRPLAAAQRSPASVRRKGGCRIRGHIAPSLFSQQPHQRAP